MRIFVTLGDLLLAKAVRQAPAEAACSIRTYYEYKCGQGMSRYRRSCTRHPNCTTTCTSWVWAGSCL
ncbi:hypothetical protein LX16_4323 [Stackebrandtia albiflava]|uniref:Uncharacterized protein n=1 Tax=Stackebrandtia albiflava TaxID=406432 RepID=A0A562UR55_9ACTN|nr:hypothetical protein [Stackebrandtia albiflava]TWJ08103.1 hypothetical protein LX16_4323 [Stackebrandtia albiflava]